MFVGRPIGLLVNCFSHGLQRLVGEVGWIYRTRNSKLTSRSRNKLCGLNRIQVQVVEEPASRMNAACRKSSAFSGQLYQEVDGT